MTDINMHLDDETLDRLRAGLLDDDPAELARVRAHLEQCAECHARSQHWDRLIAARVEHDRAITGARLEASRKAALEGRGDRHRRGLPRLAIAASITLALGLGLYAKLEPLSPGSENGSVTVAADADLLSELDFYVWLAQQDDGNGSLNDES